MPWRLAGFMLLLLASPSAAGRPEGERSPARPQRSKAPSTKKAPSLEAAAALEELRFSEAMELAQTGIKAGGLLPSEVASLYFIWARALAAMDRSAEAQALFARALELAPLTLVGEDVAPKVLEPFREAEATIAGLRLELRATSEWMSTGKIRTRLGVTNDRMGLVKSLSLEPAGRPALPNANSPGPEQELLWTCETPPCAYAATALDEHQNVLARSGTLESPLWMDAPLAPPSAVAAARVEKRSFWTRPSTYLVAASGFAVASLGMTTAFLVRQSQLEKVSANRAVHRFEDAQSLDSARKQYRAGAFALGGVSVGLCATAIVVW